MASGITLTEIDPATLPTPDATKDTIFMDATASPPAPAYMDSSRVVTSLIGPAGPAGPAGPTGSITVNPNGALDGDGSGGAPLGVLVDGVTVGINASNELEALAGVIGPGSSTVRAIARFADTSGQVLENSTPTIADDGTIASVTDPTSLQDAATKNYVDSQIAAVNVGGAAQNSFLVSGGQVVWVANYQFSVSAAIYYIQGVLYSSAGGLITLDAADATLDRLDVIAVDNTGTVVKITGTAAAQPSEPDTDVGTQLDLAIVLVTHATSAPPAATSTLVYEDDAGSPTEWNWSASAGSIVVNSINNPRSGTRDIEGTAVAAGVYAQGQIGSGTFNPNNSALLVMYIRSKATWNPNRGLQVSLRLSGVLEGSSVTINRSGTFGFDSSITGSYQQVAIPISAFAVPTGTLIDQVRITDFGGSIGFYIDDISFQGSAATQGTSGITQAQADARYIQGSAVRNGLTYSGGHLDVNVDNETIGLDSNDKLQVIAPYIPAGAVRRGLTYAGGYLDVNVDNETIGIDSHDKLEVIQNYAIADAALGSTQIVGGAGGSHVKGINVGSGLSLSGNTLSATSSGGGALTKVEAQTVSGASAITMVSWYSASYDSYLILVRNLVPSATSNIQIQVSTNGGSTWDSSLAYSWQGNYGYSAGVGPINGAGITAWTYRNSTTAVISGGSYTSDFVFHNPSQTSLHKQINGWWTVHDASIGPLYVAWMGVWSGSSAVNGLQWTPTTGTLSGTIEIFGYQP